MRLFNVKYFCLLTFFIITSCQFDEKQDLIDKDMMVQILIKYNISEELYRQSYSYYFFEPEELDKIYEVMLDSLLLYQQTK